MKRSAELRSLSRDHHAALAHAMRLRQTTIEDVHRTVAVFLAYLLGSGLRHFAAEEDVLLPELPREASALATRVRDEHAQIRRDAEMLGNEPDLAGAHALGELLAAHVRFEERELFARLESLPLELLKDIGLRLEAAERGQSVA